MPTALPASSDFIGAAVTEGDFKAKLSALRDFLAGLLGADGAVTTALGTLGAPLSALLTKTGAYTVAAADRGRIINGSGTWSLALLAAATAGDGFTVSLRNGGSGVITIDPNLSELIDGAATATLNAGETCVIYCDGTAWYLLFRASGVPSGAMIGYGGAGSGGSPPSGWLWCDGSAVSRTTYASLFVAIGTVYGVGDGSSTFNIPDLRGRVIAGQDDMGGSAANRLTTAGSGVDGATLGAVGGSQTHTLTVAQMPAHAHSAAAVSSTLAAPRYENTSEAYPASGGTGSTGGGDPHNNQPPTLVANVIIKA